jgi:ribosomal protein S18 acetylase RimI-like enzyme
MPFSIRRAMPEDAPALTDIHVRARRESMSYLPDTHSPEDVLEWIREVMLAHEEVWVAELDGKVIGFFGLSEDLLYHLYVYPELHGQGAGSALFDLVKELRPDGFRLWVFQRNTQAREFYEHRGMRIVELTDGSGNEAGEPDALYEWVPPSPGAGGSSRTRAAP